MNLFFGVIIDLLLITAKNNLNISISKLFLQHRHENNTNLLKLGFLRVVIFLWGWVNLNPPPPPNPSPVPSYFKKNLSNINTTAYNCQTFFLKYAEIEKMLASSDVISFFVTRKCQETKKSIKIDENR